MASALSDSVEASDEGSAPCGGERRGKRDREQADEDSGGSACKEPRLSASERMQLRLLANVPELRDYRRDARGRRRAVFLTSGSLIDAGLSAIVATHTTVSSAASEGGDDLVDDRPSAETNIAEDGCGGGHSRGGECSGSGSGGGATTNRGAHSSGCGGDGGGATGSRGTTNAEMALQRDNNNKPTSTTSPP